MRPITSPTHLLSSAPLHYQNSALTAHSVGSLTPWMSRHSASPGEARYSARNPVAGRAP
jgi:hypothetical protein